MSALTEARRYAIQLRTVFPIADEGGLTHCEQHLLVLFDALGQAEEDRDAYRARCELLDRQSAGMLLQIARRPVTPTRNPWWYRLMGWASARQGRGL